jgi:hypothetical protein
MITAVRERLTFDLKWLKERLFIPSDIVIWDEFLLEYWALACEQIDNSINNPFLDDDGNEVELPMSIKFAALELVRLMYRRDLAHKEVDFFRTSTSDVKTGRLSSGQTIKSIKTEDESVTYNNVRDSLLLSNGKTVLKPRAIFSKYLRSHCMPVRSE